MIAEILAGDKKNNASAWFLQVEKVEFTKSRGGEGKSKSRGDRVSVGSLRIPYPQKPPKKNPETG